MDSATRQSLTRLAEVLKTDVGAVDRPTQGTQASAELHEVLASCAHKLGEFSRDELRDDAAQIEVEYRFPCSAATFSTVVDRLTALFGTPSRTLETVLTFRDENSHVRSTLSSSTGKISLDTKTKLVDCVVGSTVVDGRLVNKTWCASLEEPVADDQITQASKDWSKKTGALDGSVAFPLESVTDVQGAAATKEELAESWEQLRFLSIGRKPNRQFINLPAKIAEDRHLALGDVTVTIESSCKTTTKPAPGLQPTGVKQRRRLMFNTKSFRVDCTRFRIEGLGKTMYNVEIEFDMKRTQGFTIPEELAFLLD